MPLSLGLKWEEETAAMEETNGRLRKHKTFVLQRNTITKFIKKIWGYITIFSLFTCVTI